MPELRSALDGLAEVDLAGLSDDALLELIAAWSAAVNRVTAALTRAVRAADRREAHRRDGAVSMQAWLRGTCHLAPAEAAAIATTGRRLEQLPATSASFAAGHITATHARVITRPMTPRRLAKAAELGVPLGETDAILAALARRTPPDETARGVARWVAGVDPDGALDDAADVRRRLSMASGFEGRVHLRGWLDPVGGEHLHSALTALMNGDRPAADRRSYGERMGDALVALARAALGGGSLPDVRGERPHVRVTVDWQSPSAARSAAGVAGGQLGWAGPVTPETARRLACDASVVRIITGPDGLPLDVGRAQRTAGAAIRRAVELRDGHCVFAGCDAPPEWCDVGLPGCGGRSGAEPGIGDRAASGTTPRATRAGSGSPAIPGPAGGAPTGPTAPRSSAAPAPHPAPGRDGVPRRPAQSSTRSRKRRTVPTKTSGCSECTQ